MSHGTQNQAPDNAKTTTTESALMPLRCSLVQPTPNSPLVTSNGAISPLVEQFLFSLPTPPQMQIFSSLRELDDYLQEAVFRKNAGKFSYELKGAQPTPEQCAILEQLGFIGEARVTPGTEFDTAVVWGGTLAAVEGRIQFLLDQGAIFARVVLLGTHARTLDKGEKTHPSETEAAMKEFLVRANAKTGRNLTVTSFPTNEAEMITFAWNALKPTALEDLPVLTIDTPGRRPEHLLAKYKPEPGTADTFYYLLLFARENGIDLGTRFIAASSQPHVLRQTVDAEFKLRAVEYPFDLLCGIGKENTSASLTLYLQEVAKLVNTQFRISTLDVLHSQHPDIVNAPSVLTVGSKKAGYAFRQSEPFEIKKPSGSSLGGRAGDYVLVFKVPEGEEVSSELIQSIIKDGIPSNDYWISIINGDIMHNSYSLSPESEQTIGDSGLSFGERHSVYKAAGLKQKAYIPNQFQREVRSLESAHTGTNQSVDPNELVLIDVEGNPYPKWVTQFVEQYKPDPSDPRSVELFEQVRTRYASWLPAREEA
jgi:hypothetical protein